MSKYPIREEDNHFYEDDYHDLHGVEFDIKFGLVCVSVGLAIVIAVMKMIYG